MTPETPKDRDELLELMEESAFDNGAGSTEAAQAISVFMLQDLEAAGLRIMPAIETEEMVEAGLDDPNASYCDRCMQSGHVRNSGFPAVTYRAMLAASPFREKG